MRLTYCNLAYTWVLGRSAFTSNAFRNMLYTHVFYKNYFILENYKIFNDLRTAEIIFNTHLGLGLWAMNRLFAIFFMVYH